MTRVALWTTLTTSVTLGLSAVTLQGGLGLWPKWASATSPGSGAAMVVPALAARQDSAVLRDYQTDTGLIVTFRAGAVADPYFGLYALELAQRAGLDVRGVALRFIEWGLREQRADGFFERYCKEESWQRCGRADSDDATLARWLQLLARQSTPQTMPKNWEKSFDAAHAALMSLKMRSGIYSVYPPGTKGYDGYALFKDNVEVLQVFTFLESHFAQYGIMDKARLYGRKARELRAAMHKHFGAQPFGLKTLALGASYDRERFYPHAVAVPFGWMEGYFEPPTQGAWARWLTQYRDTWYEHAKRDFPWGLVALAAWEGGQDLEARAWLEAYRGQRERDERWNVLEEVSFLILKRRLGLIQRP